MVPAGHLKIKAVFPQKVSGAHAPPKSLRRGGGAHASPKYFGQESFPTPYLKQNAGLNASEC